MSNKFRVALRIVTAINDHKHPSADDVVELRSWFAEDGNRFEAYELAHFVINAEGGQKIVKTESATQNLTFRTKSGRL